MQKKKKMKMKNNLVISCQFYEEEKPDLQWGQIISVVASTFCATKIDNFFKGLIEKNLRRLKMTLFLIQIVGMDVSL